MLKYEFMNMFLLFSTMFVCSSIIIMVKNNKTNQLHLMTIIIHVENSTTQQQQKKPKREKPSRKNTKKYSWTLSPKYNVINKQCMHNL
jgi:hypothetical protein